jgi:DNA-binding MarR family transcriptional regulator
MAKQLIELMFGAYRRRLLAQLLLRPDEKFHVRELGRMTGIPVGSIHRELKALSEAGLLLREHLKHGKPGSLPGESGLPHL